MWEDNMWRGKSWCFGWSLLVVMVVLAGDIVKSFKSHLAEMSKQAWTPSVASLWPRQIQTQSFGKPDCQKVRRVAEMIFKRRICLSKLTLEVFQESSGVLCGCLNCVWLQEREEILVWTLLFLCQSRKWRSPLRNYNISTTYWTEIPGSYSIFGLLILLLPFLLL